VQDAAYGSLLKQERRELHRVVGETIEQLYAEHGGELAGILAMHFELAGDVRKAVDYLVADGTYALERNALREAYSAFDRARTLLPERSAGEDEWTTRRRVEVEIGRTRAMFTFMDPEETWASLDSVVDDAERLGDLELIAQVHLYLALIEIDTGRPATDPAIQRSLRRVTEIGDQLHDPSLGALPLALAGLNKVFLGPVAEGVAALENAIPLMERRRDFIGAAFSRGWLAIGYAELGEFDKADVAERHATEEAARGDLIAQLDAQIAQAMVRSLRGDLDAALPIAQECVEKSQETGATACAVVSTWVLGDVYQRQGRFDDARDVLQLGHDMAPALGPSGNMWRPTLIAWLGSAQVMSGLSDPDDARWQQALTDARAINNRPGEAGILWKRAEVHARRGRHAEALADFAAAAAILEEQGMRPNFARVLRGWGETLRASGDPEQADAKLRQALELFDTMGLEKEVQATRLMIGGASTIQLG
jgi:tetratricopeptide (TPR) repeat protein